MYKRQIYVPAAFCKDSIIEAAYAGIKLIVCITEGIPALDMLDAKVVVDSLGVRLIGPNCPGIITPVSYTHLDVYKRQSVSKPHR